jgi:hypothetical protein
MIDVASYGIWMALLCVGSYLIGWHKAEREMRTQAYADILEMLKNMKIIREFKVEEVEVEDGD